jgi:translation initiation factor 2 alpha subunit (eIF-2alpha)
VTGYRFRFARFIDGVETTDSILIGVRLNGEIGMTKVNNLGELKDFDISKIDMEELYREVEKKLKTIYGNSYVGFEKDGAKLSKLVDGRYVFEYVAEVQIKTSSNTITRGNAALLITID